MAPHNMHLGYRYTQVNEAIATILYLNMPLCNTKKVSSLVYYTISAAAADLLGTRACWLQLSAWWSSDTTVTHEVSS